jgi:hypothetical protein
MDGLFMRRKGVDIRPRLSAPPSRKGSCMGRRTCGDERERGNMIDLFAVVEVAVLVPYAQAGGRAGCGFGPMAVMAPRLEELTNDALVFFGDRIVRLCRHDR